MTSIKRFLFLGVESLYSCVETMYTMTTITYNCMMIWCTKCFDRKLVAIHLIFFLYKRNFLVHWLCLSFCFVHPLLFIPVIQSGASTFIFVILLVLPPASMLFVVFEGNDSKLTFASWPSCDYIE